jgi:hypothetical protein
MQNLFIIVYWFWASFSWWCCLYSSSVWSFKMSVNLPNFRRDWSLIDWRLWMWMLQKTTTSVNCFGRRIIDWLKNSARGAVEKLRWIIVLTRLLYPPSCAIPLLLGKLSWDLAVWAGRVHLCWGVGLFRVESVSTVIGAHSFHQQSKEMFRSPNLVGQIGHSVTVRLVYCTPSTLCRLVMSKCDFFAVSVSGHLLQWATALVNIVTRCCC